MAPVEKTGPDEVRIRAGRLDEAEALLRLWRQAEATVSATDTVEDVRRVLAGGPACVLVAEAAGQIVGSVIGTFDGWRGNIYRLAVHPTHRRRGIARALVAEVERWMAAQGARRVTALVEKEHAWAHAFWSAVGYGPDARSMRFVRSLEPTLGAGNSEDQLS
jgi:ribosomal protein S18 acetylase RimI-like enzyme